MGSSLSKGSTSDPSAFATKVGNGKSEKGDNVKIYDYIIVGAGACGCVLANRLSEDSNVSVLLVEAGASNAGVWYSQIPAAFTKLMKTKYDWEYYTTPQPTLNNRKLFWPRGKMLGGSTSINAMMYHHCAPSDFDEWERLGAVGWGYKDLSPYFKKSEKFTPHVLYPNVKPEERGDSGLWKTSYSYCAPISKDFIAGAEEVGIPHNPDINTPRGTLGVTKIVTFIDSNGRRSSAATAYLSPEVLARKNLTVAVHTTVTRVLLSSDATPKAIGVELAKSASSPRYRASARKEVILSAGALNTPQLLNLSGIGAREELEKFNIPVVKDLPAVGKNLYDHIVPGVVLFRAKKGHTLNFLLYDVLALPHILRWYFFKSGPATTNAAEIAAFVRSDDPKLPLDSKAAKPFTHKDTTSGPNAPDIELIAVPVAFIDHGQTKGPWGTEPFSVGPVLLRPLSKGTVYLKSASPFDYAVVDPNHFANPYDMQVAIKSVRLILRIGRSKAMSAKLNLKPRSTDKKDIFWPGDADPDEITDEDIEAHIKQRSETLYHPVGTAKMGTSEKDSVVDTELKVHGIDNLRVIDASVFPTQISGHPTATLIAMAEKASEMISKA